MKNHSFWAAAGRALAVATVTLIVMLGLLAGPFAYSSPIPPFQHIIVVIQENRTADNLFGGNPTFEPGVNIAPAPNAQTWCLGACFDPQHSHEAWEGEYHGEWCSPKYVKVRNCVKPTYGCKGKTRVPSCPQQTVVSPTDDNSAVAPYFAIAQSYGFANYMFQTNQGGSMPAHQFLFSGTSATTGDPTQHYYNYFAMQSPWRFPTGCASSATVQLIDPSGKDDPSYKARACYTHPSLPTLLDPAGISWKYYSGNPDGIWAAPATMSDICLPLAVENGNVVCSGYDWVHDVVLSHSQVLTDLGANSNDPKCDLPQVSWVIPDGKWSDHPGFGPGVTNSKQKEYGPSWVGDIVDAVGGYDNVGNKLPKQCNYWSNTAIFITWDDWGGFYDHVKPYEVLVNTPENPCTGWGCGYVTGFRVPLLVVSAYTKPGYVSGAWSGKGKPPTACPIQTSPQYCHDFGSILAFIENNFGLGVGSINPPYPFADFFAPDNIPNVNVPLSDFFNSPTALKFKHVPVPYGASCFINAGSCWKDLGPEDPDDDFSDAASIDSDLGAP